MKIIGVFLASWIVGLAAYLGSLALFYRQSISSGDLSSVLLSSLLAFALAFFALYLPVLLGVRRLLRGVRPLWAFPLLGVLLGVVPTALILFFWGGGLRSLLSPEASLFYSMFAVVGVVVGFGFAFIYRHDRAA
jgi:drug/metabolite transporter (DMT)-like permease